MVPHGCVGASPGSISLNRAPGAENDNEMLVPNSLSDIAGRCLALCLLAWPLAAAAQQARLEPGTMAARVAACTACHGEQGRAGPDGYYPRLAGKPESYLYQQLLHFRDGRRQYPPMTHLLTGLPDGYLREIAAYFSDQHVPYPAAPPAEGGAGQQARGRALVFEGDPARGLPACVSCHGQGLGGMLPAIPGLRGLPRDYIVAQIGSWQNGLRRAAAPDCMASVAHKLTPQDVGALSYWLSAQPVPGDYAPGAGQPLPVACGSQEGAVR